MFHPIFTGVAAMSMMANAAPVSAQHETAHGRHAAAAATRADMFSSARIGVEVVGQGPDVVLIPGLGSSPTVWRDMVAANPGYRYHLVQVRGFAGIAADDNGSGEILPPIAEEIARYIAEAGLDRPAVIGHSLGGSLGMLLATRHPESVGRLMVVDMFPAMPLFIGGPSATPDSVRPVAEQMRAAQTAPSQEQRAAQARAAIDGMVRDEGKRSLALADHMGSDPAVLGQALYELFTLDLRADLARFPGPLSVLWVVPAGVPMTPDMLGQIYAAGYAAAPQASVTWVADSGHFIMWDQPERFYEAVRGFLPPSRPAG